MKQKIKKKKVMKEDKVLGIINKPLYVDKFEFASKSNYTGDYMKFEISQRTSVDDIKRILLNLRGF
jgi:hypothetical protein